VKGLRIYPFDKKAVATFVVDEKSSTVRILNVFYGGRDYETILS
jgi:plasmid stabilization system protein ParE